ncbi:MAG: hypothetical protein H7242_12225 [Microbacteriaceae bacterium]|nr:hypothetical protein [Burkholderiaceae bacterium]
MSRAQAAAIDHGAIYPERRVIVEGALDTWALSLWGRVKHGLPRALWARSPAVSAALRQEAATRALSDADLAAALHTHARDALHRDAALACSLALVREVARRTLGLTPFPTQLLGASLLLRGKLAEMQTGEGKTLTAGLAAVIGACARLPVHVVTVNDYLAERDAAKLKPVCDFLGLSVGVVLTPMSLDARRPAYASDITYITGKELVFDYLKDKVATQGGRSRAQLDFDGWLDNAGVSASAGGKVSGTLLRGLHFAIVDEADSIFIDEARTPLILSLNAGASDNVALYRSAIALASQLELGPHFRIRLATRELELTDHGRSVIAELGLKMGLGPDWSVKVAREHHVSQALRALHLFQRDQHYVLKDDKVLIVDEQTGRVMPGRTWEHGLHQMIEVKEGMALSDQARTVARITYQRFFRRYLLLAGMTGTAHEVRDELWAVYGLQTVVVPTHRHGQRRVEPLRCLPNEAAKWQAVCEQVARLHAQGRPVLVGTRSVAASHALSAALQAHGLPHRVLNALQDAHEAELVESAGERGRVTVATNMAGRGTDIALGPGVGELGGLHVILTEFHESRRVDRQLFGRAARQGDPGSAQALISLEDALIAHHAPLWRLGFYWLPGAAARRAFVALLRRRCQNAAEGQNGRQRSAANRSDREIENMLSFTGKN